MRRALWLTPVLLAISGCYLPPAAPDYGYAQTGNQPQGYAQPGYPPQGYDQAGYAQPGYAQPGYPPPGYSQPAYPQPGYPPPDANPYTAYPGYSYNDGAPVFIEDGAPMPLIFFGGEWGYYDHDRRWHRAPEGVSRDLSNRRAGVERFRQDRGASPALFQQPRPGAEQYRRQPQATQPQQGHDRRDCEPGQHC